MRAIKIASAGKANVVDDAEKPSLRPDYIHVKVYAVALNPTDWKHINWVSAPVTVGCDYAGVVEDVGDKVTKKWTPGDRVCGVLHGSNQSRLDDGAFGEYCVAKGDLQLRIPEGMSFEAAAGLGMGVSTVGQGMYQELGLPWPSLTPKPQGKSILIYGGSTAMGAYAIQYGVASGLTVLTTCSPRNFDYVKSLGATRAWDYNSPSCGADIREHTRNTLTVAWDAVGEGNSSAICGDALASPAPAGARLEYANVLHAEVPREDVTSASKLMYTTFGEEFVKGTRTFPALQEDLEFMKKFVATSEELIAAGKIVPHRFDAREGGLEGVLKGLQDMKEGKVSAQKLVYRL